MKKTITFNQVISGTFALLCLVALICMYFFTTKVSSEIGGGIVVAFVVAFKDFANAFVKEHSDTQPLIEALKNSTPIPNQPNSTQTSTTTTNTTTDNTVKAAEPAKTN